MRKYNLLIGASLCCAMLSSCATTSFAPPPVDVRNVKPEGCSLNGSGARQGGAKGGSGAGVRADRVPITPDFAGARKLINNFVETYRCAAHSAANGRQAFEVPSILIAAGTVTAAAFGAGPNVAIAGGAGSAVLGAGKNYYSPQQKAQFFDHALDALLCIKNESVGVAAYDTSSNLSTKGQTIPVSASSRYFEMVESALLSVERILSQRLSASGQFDPAGLIAEIEAVDKKVKAAEAKADPQPAPTPTPTPTPAPAPAPGSDTDSTSTQTSGATSTAETIDPPVGGTLEELMNEKPASSDIKPQEGGTQDSSSSFGAALMKLLGEGSGFDGKSGSDIDLDLDVLQPKLQQCVIRAKL